MVKREHEPTPGRPEPEQRDSPQRANGKVEATSPVISAETQQNVLLHIGIESQQIAFDQFHIDAVQHLLLGNVDPVPPKPGPQHGVTGRDFHPSRLQQPCVDVLAEVADDLLDVDTDIGSLQMMEEHSLLQR